LSEIVARLHTTIVSFNRPELLKRTVESYLETVTLPYSLIIVDNGSDDTSWLARIDTPLAVLLGENRYPGYAANHGFAYADEDVSFLHRSDSDMEYQPGWCEEVVERFQDPTLGQLGLRTLEEEGNHAAVGGNAVFRRELWDAGLRYDERPWTEVPFEDATMSRKVHRLGYRWDRVQRPCALHIGIASRDDPYYQQTFADRGITFEQWRIK
jgi:glycosyltransferase involved in cell wall biosynthesis